VNSRFVFFGATLIMLASSIIGGGRGDVIASVFMVSVCLVLHYPRSVIVLAPIFLVGGMFYVGLDGILGELVIVDRLLNLEHSFGLRDVLAQESINLLFSDPKCLLVGGGFGYFQDYYGYDYGKYPHNFLLESLITFGLPLTILMMGLAMRGIYLQWISAEPAGAGYMFFGYFFLISLKSGSFTGSWFVLAGTIVWITRNFEVPKKNAACRRRSAERKTRSSAFNEAY